MLVLKRGKITTLLSTQVVYLSTQVVYLSTQVVYLSTQVVYLSTQVGGQGGKVDYIAVLLYTQNKRT